MIIANVVGIVFLFYFLWKRLKEDFHFEKIFTLGVYILAGIIIGLLISRNNLDKGWFWLSLTGGLAGFLIGLKRLKMSFFEALEALLIGLLGWLDLFYFAHSIENFNALSFVAFWVTLCLFFLFLFLEGHYRRFSWFKSGKVGFSGLVVSLSFFLIRTVIALFNLSVISFLPSGESILSGLTTLILLVMLYKLSKQ